MDYKIVISESDLNSNQFFNDDYHYVLDMSMAFKSGPRGGKYFGCVFFRDYEVIPKHDSGKRNEYLSNIVSDFLEELYKTYNEDILPSEFIDKYITDYGKIGYIGPWWESGVEAWKTRELEKEIKLGLRIITKENIKKIKII